MLKVWVKGFQKGCITDPGKYFNLIKKDEWFNREDIRGVIKEIDNTKVIQDGCLLSPVFGYMSPERLSSGCKSTILLYMDPTCNVYATRCGDNCFPSIIRLAQKTDVIITLHHFPKIEIEDFTTEFLDTGVVMHDVRGFYDELTKLIYGWT